MIHYNYSDSFSFTYALENWDNKNAVPAANIEMIAMALQRLQALNRGRSRSNEKQDNDVAAKDGQMSGKDINNKDTVSAVGTDVITGSTDGEMVAGLGSLSWERQDMAAVAISE